jgi:hypothetical protein
MGGGLFPVAVDGGTKNGAPSSLLEKSFSSFAVPPTTTHQLSADSASGSSSADDSDSDEPAASKARKAAAADKVGRQRARHHKRKRDSKKKDKDEKKKCRRKTKKADAEKIAESERLVGELLKDRRGGAHADIWASARDGTGGGANANVYYTDTKPDRDNLAYGGLYRVDIAKFHRHGWVGAVTASSAASAATAADRRYFSSRVASRERSRGVRRLKLKEKRDVPRARPEPLGDDFVSFGFGNRHRDGFLGGGGNDEEEGEEEGESVDDYLARRTREFNEAGGLYNLNPVDP